MANWARRMSLSAAARPRACINLPQKEIQSGVPARSLLWPYVDMHMHRERG